MESCEICGPMKKLLLILSLLLPAITGYADATDWILKQKGLLDEKAELKMIQWNDKSIAFIGMMHLGKKSFYEDVKRMVDSLQKEGYTVFYEGSFRRRQRKELDTVCALKCRKLTGLDATRFYSETVPFQAQIAKHQLVDQPDYPDLGVIEEQSVSADLGLKELITAYEKEYRVIELDECDYKSPLGTKYTCSPMGFGKKVTFQQDFIIDKRNAYVAETIKSSTHNKIVVLYGKAHYRGIRKLLKK